MAHRFSYNAWSSNYAHWTSYQ